MKAAELRMKLAEGLRADVSGKTTPIQRLTPFLEALVSHLEQNEISLAALGDGNAIDAVNERNIPDRNSSADGDADRNRANKPESPSAKNVTS